MLGATDPEVIGLLGATVRTGDPTFSGPLANVSLNLPVYHVFEPAIKDSIPPDVYASSVGKLEILHDVPSVVSAVQRLRAGSHEAGQGVSR